MNNHPMHNCEDSFEERTATQDQPYRYVGSGLPNVLLTGIKYFVCRVCGKQTAEIPALKELLTELARTVVEKQSKLTGSEVRFLRKRLSKKGVDFAPMIGITPVHLSRLESSEKPIEDGGRDKLIRLIYRALSGDSKLNKVLSMEKHFAKWITSVFGPPGLECIMATRTRNNRWVVEQRQAA